MPTYNRAVFSFNPLGASPAAEPTKAWEGNHRLFAIARASGIGTPSIQPAVLRSMPNTVVPFPTTATVWAQDWSLYDLGVITFTASEPPQQLVSVLGMVMAPSMALDVAAFAMLPDATTWFFEGAAPGNSASQYGYPPVLGSLGIPSSTYTSTFLLDDTLSDQFLYAGQSQTFAPSPLGMVASSTEVTNYSRGTVPRPDPKLGLPIIAVLGVAQANAVDPRAVASSYWPNPQNLRTLVQVNVLERTRYVLP